MTTTPDLSRMLPRLYDFARAIGDQIGVDARTRPVNNGRALAYAASAIAFDIRDVPALEAEADYFTQHLRRERHYATQNAWLILRSIRAIQLTGRVVPTDET